MSQKYDTFRICPKCKEMVPTSSVMCNCGYVLQPKKFRRPNYLSFSIWPYAVLVFAVVLFFKSVSFERDLERAQLEIESQNEIIFEYESQIEELKSKNRELLYELELAEDELYYWENEHSCFSLSPSLKTPSLKLPEIKIPEVKIPVLTVPSFSS